MKISKLVLSFFALFSLVCVFPIFPQSHSNEAHVTGNITDDSGRGVGGVHISVQPKGAANGLLRTATSTADGAFTISLPPGSYLFHFSSESFAARDFTVDLASGESRTLDLRLDLEPLSSSVIVTAQTLPVSEPQTNEPIDVITREDIENRQAVDLPSILQYSPGVVFGRTGAFGGTASIFLDGGNSNFTKVLVDGTPINPPGGAVDFSILTTDNIDKIEIVHGAESAVYGTDAVSGVVQLFSHRGTTRVPAISVFSEGGSFSSGRGGGQISGLLAAFDYSGAASYLETNGQGPNDDFLNRTLSGNFGYTFSENNQIRFSLRNNTSDAGIPGQTIFTPPSLYQRYNQHLFSANARWDFASGPHWHYQISGTESSTHQHSFNPQQSFYATDPNAFCPQTSPTAVATPEFCDSTYDSLYKYNRAGFTAQASYVLRNLAVTAGYQYEVENAFIYFLELGHVRRNNQGGYLDIRYSPVSRLSLDVAARAEDNNYFGTRVVPRVGGSLALRYGKGFWGDTRYRAFYGEGIKEPRFDQLYSDQFGDIGNPSLKPEASKTWSTGVEQKLANDRVKLTAEYFSNRFYNIVSFGFCSPLPPPATGNTCGITLPGAPPSFGYYFNTDLARARGTSISAEARAAKWLFITGNYTYDDSLILKSPNATDPSLVPGNRLARRPPNSGSITFIGTFGRFNATFAGYFIGQRTDSDFLGLGLTRDPGYARFDLSGSYAFSHGISIYARATNLFNKSYQDALGYPALGRDAQIGVRYHFSGRD
jgi:vitamin B12 transporter